MTAQPSKLRWGGENYQFIENRIAVLITIVFHRAIQWLVAIPSIKGNEERKSEFKTLAQAAIHRFAPIISKFVVSTAAGDVRINGVNCIKKVRI